MLVITNQVLKDADTRQIFKFKVNYAWIFSQTTLKQLKENMTEIVQAKFAKKSSYFSTSSVYKIDQLRLWKLDSEISLSEAFDYVRKICNNTNSYDYRIDMKGKSLENDLDMKLGDLDLKENEYMIVEVREENKGWNFIHEGVANMEKCEYCNKYDKLTTYCACKKVRKLIKFCDI